MSTLQPFSPANTVPIAATTSSQNFALDPSALWDQVRLVNMTTGVVYVLMSKNAADIVSAANGVPLLAGTAEVFTKGDATRIAVIAASAGNLAATLGNGV
ncbi:hypothetical protein WM40_22640 [Robbsia andropogonis]|uniref:Uncharacterized protein n=1 Tax=Robbsia andropogonis TaxID=28092 RepID=A0A0F5JUN1_9BURK|nr:hypothetical protein [Robbsia andropogonis]KKB61541.1 hypothetical protein WM40_22640 [Robbsia andropogonis]